MTPDCLLKAKAILSPENYAKLKEAAEAGDSVLWNERIDEIRETVSKTKEQHIIDMNKKVELANYFNAQLEKGISLERAFYDLISGSGTNQLSGVTSLDMEVHGVRGQYLANLVDMIHEGRPKVLGLSRSRNKNFARDLTKAIFGDSDAKVSKEIQVMRDAWAKTLEAMRLRFNKAGGDIPKYNKFFIPTNHDPVLVLKAGKESWIKFADEHFDIIEKTYKKEATKREILETAYENITKDSPGEVSVSELDRPNLKKMANKHQVTRVLQPKSGDSWLKYNSKFGRHSSPIDAMIEHVDGFSTEIATLEKFGSNPKGMVDSVANMVRQRTGKRVKVQRIMAAYDQVISQNPPSKDTTINILRGFRNYQTAIKLPFAALTATSDIIYSTTRALFDGMSPVRGMARMIKNLNPANNVDRITAGRLGLMMDYALYRAASLNRYSDYNGYGALHRVADFSTRLSGLNFWTNAAKTTFGLEILNSLARFADEPLEKLNGGMRRMIEKYGLAADWDMLRNSVSTINGEKFIDVMQDQVPDDVKSRFLAMIKEETIYAVPEPNARAHAASTLWSQKNTLPNEILKTAAQFKPFAVSVMLSSFGTVMDKGIPTPVRALYGVGLFAGTAAIGTLIVQANEIFNGRTPRDWEDPALYVEGAVKGGLAGILGDILATDPDSFGGLPKWAIGPTGGDIVDLHRFAVKEIIGDKDWQDNLSAGTMRQLQKHAFFTRIVPTRLAFENLLWENMRRSTDPKFNQKLLRKQKRLRKQGQETFRIFD